MTSPLSAAPHVMVDDDSDVSLAQTAHLSSLIAQTPAPIAVLRGPELVFEVANELYLKLCDRSDVVGQPLSEAVPELARQGVDEILLTVMRTGETHVRREVPRRVDRDGRGVLRETFWTFTYAPLRSPGGSVDRVIVLATDVTAHVLARRRVEQSEERFRRIVTQVRAGIAETDLTGRVTLTNSHYRDLVGRSEEELRQLRLLDFTHQDDLGRSETAFRKLLADGVPFEIEKRYLKPDGSIVWVQKSASRIEDEAGQPQGAAVVTLDITQRKYAAVELENAVRFSEMFIGILGHDLRNPLSAIMTAAHLLEGRVEGRADSDKITTPVRRIASSADRMERMISQLLDFTRIRLGRGLPLHRSRVDLGALCRSIIEELAPVQNRDIQLTVRGDPIGAWDGDRLLQLVSNLTANACQHGAPGTSVAILVDGSDPATVRVSVENRGCIPEELLPVIFEPLRYSGEQRTRTKGSSGLGLGLYITQQVAVAHGGSIRVESPGGLSTRFVVELPRRSSKDDAPLFDVNADAFGDDAKEEDESDSVA